MGDSVKATNKIILSKESIVPAVNKTNVPVKNNTSTIYAMHVAIYIPYGHCET
jgi:hypothetical protein